METWYDEALSGVPKLGVLEFATAEEIKRAYKKQVQFFHPDRFLGQEEMRKEAETKMASINGAYNRIKGTRQFE